MIASSKLSGVAVCAVAYVAAAAAAAGVAAALAGHHGLWIAAAADLAATLVVFGFSAAFGNSSLYDPYWSVAPPVLAGAWAYGAVGAEGLPRRLIVLGLVGAWAVRLTYNWLRRWDGLADEDWRYVDIRRRTGRGYWLASLGAIHLLPTVVVFLGCLPLYAALRSERPLDALDLLATAITASAIVIEAVADRQLHQFRRQGQRAGVTLGTGLWARCRHPNYAGEILFWWGLLAFGLAADRGAWWTGIGAASVTALFVLVSVPLIDRRMLARRSDYAERMQRLGALLPRWRW